MKDRTFHILTALGIAFILLSSLASVFAFEKEITKTPADRGNSLLAQAAAEEAEAAALQSTLVVTKTADPLTVTSGASVTFTVEIFNASSQQLKQLNVVDSLPSCVLAPSPSPLLDPGAKTTASCIITVNDADTTNVVTVTATAKDIGNIVATDTAFVDVIRPSLRITKTAEPLTTTAGSSITYTVDVLNDGDVILSGLEVRDDHCNLTGLVTDVITPGIQLRYGCSVGPITADITNTATVTASHPIGGLITRTSSVFVDVIRPSFIVTKTADPLTTTAGTWITYSIDVHNDGDVDLTALKVSDSLCILDGPADTVIAPGSIYPYACSILAGGSDITNTVTVSATDPIDRIITRTDTVNVDVIRPSLAVTKTANAPTTTVGAQVDYLIEVTNDGDVNLSGLDVTDDQCDLNGPGTKVITSGVTYSYDCSVTSGEVDIFNTARVTGTTPIGTLITRTSSVFVEVFRPSLAVTKTAVPDIVTNGANVDYTIDVLNDGDYTLSNLTVVDPSCLLSGPASQIITPTIAYSYNCSITAGNVDIVNTVGVTATAPGDQVITRTADAFVNVIHPSLVVTKTAVPTTTTPGDNVRYTIDVWNNGDVDLSSLEVFDDQCTLSGPTGSVITSGVTLTYQCNISASQSSMNNTVIVTATHPAGGVLVEQASAFVDVIHPAVAITKTPTSQYVVSGNTANFSVTIENTGDVELSNVDFSDPLANNCGATINKLAPGVQLQFNCSVTPVTADFVNQAFVTARDPLNNLLSASSSAQVFAINPSIQIVKIPQSQYVYNQGTAFFTITVTNTGDVSLDNVFVADPQAANCERVIGTLAADSPPFSYACFRSNVTASFTNTAAVTGTHLLGGTVSDSDQASVTIIDPTIAIEKTPDIQTIGSGKTVSFTIFVTNTGNITLTNIQVSDPASPACASGPFVLGPGLGTSYDCSHPGATDEFFNTAFVKGFDPRGAPVEDEDVAFVKVGQADISILKTAIETTIISGGTARFRIEVQNSSGADLVNVVVTDTLAPDCSRNIGPLNGGDSYPEYECSLSNVTAPFTNLATVRGNNAINNNELVSDSDIAEIQVLELAAVLTADPPSLPEPGGTVRFDLLITNEGSKPFNLTGLNSALYGDITTLPGSTCSTSIGPIAANGGTYACSFEQSVNGQPGVINVNVTASAQDAATALVVTDTAATSVSITDLPSAIAVSLAADPTTLPEPGGTARFDLRIDNNSPQDSVTINSLDGGPLLGNLISRGLCSSPGTIIRGGSYACSFTENVSGTPGANRLYSVTAFGTDDDQVAVIQSGQATVSITNLPSVVAVTLSALPNSLPEPGGPVAFRIQIHNNSPVDTITVTSLNGGSLGNLTGKGSCNLPPPIPAGASYSCEFTAPVSGTEGQNKSFTVTASGADDDGQPFNEAGQTSVSILQRKNQSVYLPLIVTPYCRQAMPIQPNRDYFFSPNVRNTWYVFNLPASASLTVEVTNFLPIDGQVAVYRGNDNCELQFLQNNGDFSTTKTVVMGTQPASFYYILVINDGPLMTQPYRLRVRTP